MQITNESLDQILEEVRSRSMASTPSVVVKVSGGSATGKSSQVAARISSAFGDNALLIHQDDFQLGRDFACAESSPYRWDDPENFDLERTAGVLDELSKTGHAVMPTFSLETVRRGPDRSVSNRKIVILEGLYAGYGPLAGEDAVHVYVQAPFYARFVRRLCRSKFELNAKKLETPVRQCLGPVLDAHRNLVRTQLSNANYVVSLPYSFDETRSRFRPSYEYEKPSSLPVQFSRSIEPQFSWGVVGSSQELVFEMIDGDSLVYSSSISELLAQKLREIDPWEM